MNQAAREEKASSRRYLSLGICCQNQVTQMKRRIALHLVCLISYNSEQDALVALLYWLYYVVVSAGYGRTNGESE